MRTDQGKSQKKASEPAKPSGTSGSSAPVPATADGDYFALDVQTLRLDVTTNFALYIKRGHAKPVLYRGNNTAFTSQVLDNLRRNHVDQLWVHKDDWEHYQEYLAENLSEMVDDPNVPEGTKCEIAYDAATNAMEHALEAGEIDAQKMAEVTDKVFEPLTKVMLGSQDAVKKFIALTKQDYSIYTKAVNVCVLGMLMVRKIMGINDPKRLIEIGAGFLLCDIGKTSWPKEILDRRGVLLPEEWNIVKEHPLSALDLLKDIPLTEEAKVIIAQHHERADGSGYPKGLKGDEIHDLAKIASLADAFVALNSKRPFADRKKTFDALTVIRDEMQGHVDPELFAQFVQLFSKGNPLDKVNAMPMMPAKEEKKPV